MTKFQKKFFIIFVLIIFYTVFLQANPYFVLVHGAWHGEWSWFEIEELLIEAGCKVKSIHLPGHGNDNIDPGSVTLDDYSNKVIEFLDTMDQPVILVGHSMGGIVISSVAESRPQKIDKLVYLSAFLLKNGQSLLDVAVMDTGSRVLPNLTVDESSGIIKVDTTKRKEMFYQWTPEKYISLTENLLVPNPLLPFVTPLYLTELNYGSVRRFYITTIKDNAITAEIQKYMYTMQPCEKVYSIYTDHSSFFSTPNQLLNILLEIAADPSPNLLHNSQFDEGKNNWGFTVYNPEEISANYSINTNSILSGENSAEISITADQGQEWHIQFYQDIVSLESNKPYEISLSAKIENPEKENIDISVLIIDFNFTTFWKKTDIIVNNTSLSPGPYRFSLNSSIENALFIIDVQDSDDIILYLDNIVLNPN